MRIDEFEKIKGYDSSVGLAHERGTDYRFIVFDNTTGVITKLERHVGNGEWELIDEEPPVSLQALVRHRLRGFA